MRDEDGLWLNKTICPPVCGLLTRDCVCLHAKDAWTLRTPVKFYDCHLQTSVFA